MLHRVFPLAVLLLAAGAAAETDGQARHSLGAAVGLRAATVREDLLVPLSFSGTGLRVGARYAGLAGPGLLSARLDLGIRTLWTRFGQFGAGLDTEVDASWVTPVHEGGSWRVSLGPALAHNGAVHYLPSGTTRTATGSARSGSASPAASSTASAPAGASRRPPAWPCWVSAPGRPPTASRSRTPSHTWASGSKHPPATRSS